MFLLNTKKWYKDYYPCISHIHITCSVSVSTHKTKSCNIISMKSWLPSCWRLNEERYIWKHGENPGNNNENVTKFLCRTAVIFNLLSESRFLCSACSSDPLPGLLLLRGAGGHGGVAVSGPSHPPPHTWAKPQLWLEGDAPARMTAWADPLNLMMYTLGLQWHSRPTPTLPPNTGTFRPSAESASALCPRWQRLAACVRSTLSTLKYHPPSLRKRIRIIRRRFSIKNDVWLILVRTQNLIYWVVTLARSSILAIGVNVFAQSVKLQSVLNTPMFL